jgi:hypothetical protein
MAINRDSEVGQAEDLIRSFVQFGCAEIHAKGLYEKATAEMENGLIDVDNNEVLQAQLAKCEQYTQDIETYANLRRSVMRHLFQMFEGDKDVWCLIKHLGIGAMTLFEAYEASDNDPELLNMAYEANKAFVNAMSRFLGVTITDCAACFSDAMKGIE